MTTSTYNIKCVYNNDGRPCTIKVCNITRLPFTILAAILAETKTAKYIPSATHHIILHDVDAVHANVKVFPTKYSYIFSFATKKRHRNNQNSTVSMRYDIADIVLLVIEVSCIFVGIIIFKHFFCTEWPSSHHIPIRSVNHSREILHDYISLRWNLCILYLDIIDNIIA